MYVSRLILVSFLLLLEAGGPAYKAEIEAWQHKRQAALTADNGWLTVVGLFWLEEGSNSVGSGSGNNFVLPPGSAPGNVGVFDFHGGVTTFRAAPDVTVFLNGQPAASGVLKPDQSGSPDIVRLNDLTMFVIQRGNRYGVRLKDKNSGFRRNFTGLKYFPIRESYRVRAKFVPYDPPKKISIPNILGQADEESSPGYVVFSLAGHECRLDPVTEGDMLFFIFKDPTSGKETYPAGRFLYSSLPKDGEVVLDFNKAVNPPCAFTPYATCPLPPKQNYLSVRVEAGEMPYGH